jgi:NADH dehydrogenase/NADH:ubiquinone oxidoreductase subunit G
MNNTVSLTIDGQIIYAEEGVTILEAARQNGIEIPTLCYHPRLAPLGHCRVCLVQIAGIERPVTSCDNPVVAGMVVTTTTPALEEMRKGVIELVLATHPYKDCLTCVRTGTCELQDKAYCYQVELPGQLERRVPSAKDHKSPYLVRDEEKCILCGRCVEVCRSLAGRSVYGMIGRGVNTRVVPYLNGREVSLEEAGCIFCGQCIDVCPVAALTEAGRPAGGREWELSHKPGVCIECSLGCYLERQGFDGCFVKSSVADEGDPVGWLCLKGKFGNANGNGEKSFGKALLKDEDGYAETTYLNAFEKAAAKILEIKERFGADALAVTASGKLSNEENYLLQKLARKVIGTAHVDLGAEALWVEAFSAVQAISGSAAPGLTPAALSRASSLLIIGSGLDKSHPVAAMAIRKAGRFGDVVIIETAENPDAEPIAAWDSISLKTGDGCSRDLFSALSALISGTDDGSEAAARLGLPHQSLKRAAKLISGRNSCIVVCPSYFAKADSLSLEALIRLAQVSGVVERGRNNLLLLSKYSNASGVLATGGTNCSHQEISEEGNSQSVNNNDFKNTTADDVKGLLLFGSDLKSFKKSDFEYLAVFCENESEAPPGADLIITTQSIITKNGEFTNAAGQNRFNQAVVEIGSEQIHDWQLICSLARAIGVKWNYASLDEVREEMKSALITAG